MQPTWRLKLVILLTILFMVSCERRPNNEAQGYVEGRYTYMATHVPGVLMQLLVARGASVKKGQILFILEKNPESDIYRSTSENLKQSIAARDAIKANLAYAKITYERYKTLVIKHAIEQSALDNAESVYNSALAQLAQADATIASTEATLAQAKWVLEQKVVEAPVSGIVFDTYYRPGEYTEASKAVLSLLAPEDIKVIFYLSAPNLGYVQLGDKVSIKCDGCTQTYVGKISFISPTAEYTPPVIYSNETNEKLIFRIEAQLPPEEAVHLHPGQPVRVIWNS
jgi:HlyD family secretion protein